MQNVGSLTTRLKLVFIVEFLIQNFVWSNIRMYFEFDYSSISSSPLLAKQRHLFLESKPQILFRISQTFTFIPKKSYGIPAHFRTLDPTRRAPQRRRPPVKTDMLIMMLINRMVFIATVTTRMKIKKNSVKRIKL